MDGKLEGWKSLEKEPAQKANCARKCIVVCLLVFAAFPSWCRSPCSSLALEIHEIVAAKDKKHHLFCSHPTPRLAVLKEFRVQPPALPENKPTKIFEFKPAIQRTFLKVFLRLIFLWIYTLHRVAVDFALAFWMYPCVQIGAIPGFANGRSFRKFLNPLNECRWCRILRKNMDTLLVERASNDMKWWTLDYTTYTCIRQQCVQKQIRARGVSIG